MEPIFYRTIRPAQSQTEAQVIQIAQRLGFQMVQFNGWDNADIGYPGNPGPHYETSRKNLVNAKIVQDAAMVRFDDGTQDWPHVIHTAADDLHAQHPAILERIRTAVSQALDQSVTSIDERTMITMYPRGSKAVCATLWIRRGYGPDYRPGADIWIARHSQGGAVLWREIGGELPRPPEPWVAIESADESDEMRNLANAVAWAWMDIEGERRAKRQACA